MYNFGESELKRLGREGGQWKRPPDSEKRGHKGVRHWVSHRGKKELLIATLETSAGWYIIFLQRSRQKKSTMAPRV